MFFLNNHLNLKDIDNNVYYRNDIEEIKKQLVLINNEKYSFYHLCKSYILYKNENNLTLILSFDVKKILSTFNYYLKIYFINDFDIKECNQRFCIDFLCNNECHYDIKKSKLIVSIKKINVTDLMNDFPKIIQDIKKCYQCNSIWNFNTEIRLIEDPKKYDYDKCDNCKIKEYINSKTLKLIGKCVICLDNLYKKDSVKTLCKHLFHKDCLDNWTKQNSKCPLCRSKINNNQIENDSDNFILTI